MLLAAGRALESLPPDLAAALTAGKVSQEILNRYISMSASALLAPLMKIPGFRDRLLADPQFFVKVAIEVGAASEPTRRSWPMWDTSYRPAALRVWWCSAIRPAGYCTGIE